MLWICTLFFFVLFIFIHVRFEGNNKYAKKVLSQPRNSLTLQISLSLREKHDKIVFTLQFKAISEGATVFSSPRILCYFRQPTANFESRNLWCLLAKRC